MKQTYKVALAGNPNCGKTTIFNSLTGARQHVGNYSGVTVERKSGRLNWQNVNIEMVDLPGVYSLSAASPEELVALRELVEEDIDLVVNIIDAGNLQRNLYLTMVLAELQIPMVLVFNMFDEAEGKGMIIDCAKFASFFNAPVVKTVGAHQIGLNELKDQLVHSLQQPKQYPRQFKYGAEVDAAILELTPAVEALELPFLSHIPARYFAIKLLENDHTLANFPRLKPLLKVASECRSKMFRRMGMVNETFMADCRYGVIAGACREAVSQSGSQDRRIRITEAIDRVVTNRFAGLPIFLSLMFLMFFMTFLVATPFCDFLEYVFGGLRWAVLELWPEGYWDWGRSLLANGIISGVGGVLVFLPNILMLFLGIAFLEGTGYMSRAAFIMDGFMHKFGLHGKSFIPMLLGFGCSVPAIMAARTIESERDRMTTIMIVPFMSCGARLPIYALFIPALFPERWQALTMWMLYVIGVAVALICAIILKKTLFKGGDELFVMELPPYRMPTFRSIALHMWENCLMYLRKAGTIIMVASIILFVINTFPERKVFSQDFDQEIATLQSLPESDNEEITAEITAQITALEQAKGAENLEYSISGRIGKALVPVTAPIGFDWRINSSLIGAFAAKELFVSQLGIIYSVGEVEEDAEPLRVHLLANYTPLQGFSIMLFCLLTMPCIATVAAVRKESNSWLLPIMQMLGMLAIAYVASLVVFQLGSLLKIGTSLIL